MSATAKTGERIAKATKNARANERRAESQRYWEMEKEKRRGESARTERRSLDAVREMLGSVQESAIRHVLERDAQGRITDIVSRPVDDDGSLAAGGGVAFRRRPAPTAALGAVVNTIGEV